jgi:RNA polymerase sigma factor (sigma-70 family)
MTGDIHLSEDITQEVLLKVITKLSTYDPDKASFRTWLYRIVVNHVINFKESKAEKFFQAAGSHFPSTNMDEHPDTRSPDFTADRSLLEDKIKMNCIVCMLLCLSRIERIVFILGLLFDVTDKIGAEICDISRVNFRKILSRSRKKIFDYFNANCGLMNKNNPCRCADQARFLVKIGKLDAAVITNENSFGTIHAMLGNAVSNIEDSYYEFIALFRSQPFLKGPDMVRWLRNVVQNNDVINILM